MERKLVGKTLLLICMVFLIPLLMPTVQAWNTNGTRVCEDPQAQAYPKVCSDGSSGAIIVWQDHRSLTSYDIYAQRIDKTGQILWDPNGILICNAVGVGSDQEQARIISNEAGGAIIVWLDHRDWDMAIYAQRVNAAGTPQWTANGSVVQPVIGTNIWLTQPRICSDGAQGAIVVWLQSQVPSSVVYDLYAQHINASGFAQWGPNGALICNHTSNQQIPEIASDGQMGAIITWQDNRAGNNDIYAQRVNSSGSPQWTSNGSIVCNAAGSQSEPQIVSDGSTGAVIAWSDVRGGMNNGIYTQRLNSTGHPQWIANGTAVCNGTGVCDSPSIIRAATGSFILAWTDSRSGIYSEVYMQRINASGAGQWTINGIPIFTNIATAMDARVCSDSLGGAITTWFDMRAGADSDLYAQRVTSAGLPQWTANGTAVCTQNNSQSDHQIVNAGPGGAIIVWQDDRTGIYNTYALGLGIPGNGGSDIPSFGLPLVLITLFAVAYSIKRKQLI